MSDQSPQTSAKTDPATSKDKELLGKFTRPWATYGAGALAGRLHEDQGPA